MTHIAIAFARTAEARWSRLAAAIGQLHRKRQLGLELGKLDRAACRDLGIDPTEIASYGAEAAGTAARSRRRVCAGGG